MSTRKTIIENDIVLQFLQKNFDPKVANVIQLKGGEMSCPFSFTVHNEDYVIRIDPYIFSYQKDAYAWKHFASKKLPIPAMIQLGTFDEKYFFAITKKAKGEILDDFTKDETLKMMPSIIETLESIHAVDVSETSGYGYWNQEGKGEYTTWNEYLSSLNKDIDTWKKINKRDYFDQTLLDKVFDAYVPLIRYASEEKYLLHGDYGFSNVVANGENVTAVLDWGEARYGDFAFDVAWLDTWQDELSYETIFKNYYEKSHRPIQHFSERILCYKLHILYGSLKFVIESDQENQYHSIKKKFASLVEKSRI